MSKIYPSSRIVFMGTPEFASTCLDALCIQGLEVVGVVTVPDKAVGRGLKTRFSAVKEMALQHQIPILQPAKFKDPDFLEALRAWQADLFIVVAFRMLPKEVWTMPRLGTFNLHASLLPLYRGAAPIEWALWNGERQSGVTTFLLDEHLDTGAILFQEKVAIEPHDNAGTLHDKLLSIGAPLVVQTALALLNPEKTLQTKTQSISASDQLDLPAAPKIFKEDTYLNWQLPAQKLLWQIRALSPYPGAIAWFKPSLKDKPIPFKVFDAKISEDLLTSCEQGLWKSDGRQFLAIACGDGIFLSLTKIQFPGKKTLTVEEFLRGFHLPLPQASCFVSQPACP